LQFVQVTRLHEGGKPTNLPSKFFIIGNQFYFTSSRTIRQIEARQGVLCTLWLEWKTNN